ncbi:MAG: glycosyltransferase [Gallionella sp.]|jgi:putative colanic acid biosynthesis glycosyltransferase|nr:glycosyltransferase [Gallionella sp.]
MSIRISVITVVLNDVDGLKKTRESLIGQNYENFEWIVCDGGSSDGVMPYLQGLTGNVKWVSEVDDGIYDAMNRGVSMCAGEYVVFMNAGDIFFDSNALAQVANLLSVDKPEADILFGGAMLSFPESGRSVYRAPRKVERSLWHGLPANHQATFYRKVLLDKTPYDLQYRLCGDYYLAAALIRSGAHELYLDEPLAIFEVGGQSYSQRRQLFLEPYRIQRDILHQPIHYRLASMAKRFISTVGFVILSQPFFKNRSK